MNVNAIALLAAWWQCPKCGFGNMTRHDEAYAKCRECKELIRVTRITYENGAVVERK